MSRNPFAPPRTIRGTLMALIAIALAPLVAFGVYAVVDEYADQRDLEVRASAELARAVASAFDAFVQSVLRVQHAVGAAVAVHGPTPRQLADELARVNAEFPMSRQMSWVEPGGNVAASTEPELAGKSMFGRDYYQEIRRGADWQVTPLTSSLLDGAPVFVIARAIRGDDGELVGIVTCEIDPDRLGGLLGARTGGGRIAVIDSTGSVVAMQPAGDLDWTARRRARDHEYVRTALSGHEALGVYSWPGVGRRVGALVPIASLAWVVHASRSIDAAMAPARRAAVQSAAAMLFVALAALAAAVVLARRIAEPLHALEQHAARVAANGPTAAPIRGPAEVRRVARALESMAQALAKRRDDLEAMNRRLSGKEERFRLLAAAAEARRSEIEAVIAALPIGLVVVSQDGRALRVNEPAREILGASREDMSGSPDEIVARFRISRPDGQVLDIRDLPLSRALEGGQLRSEILRVERVGAVGAPVWVAVSTAPIRDPGGAVTGAVAVFVDVTQLRELQEERETLMQTVSHDLRTPLHVIVGHAEILRRRSPDEEVRRRSAAILSSAGRMTRLIGDLVDAARLEAGHVSLRLEPVDLVAFLAAWRERMAGALAMERVRVRAPESVPVVLADAGRLEQILVNLVSNALKYSVAGSEVRVELAATTSALRLSVADRGPGIAPEEVPRLFERYYRAKSAARAEGLGLGLFIARKLVDAHGWQIEVASEIGAGSVFTLVVPLAGPAPARSSAA